MAVGDLMEVKAKYTFENNTGMMVMHYRIATQIQFPVNQLADEWLEQVQPSIAALHSTEVYLSNLYVWNVFDPSSFADRSYASTQYDGVVEGVSAPPFVAVGYKAQRDRLDIRSGFKRVPFPVQAAVEEEGWAPAYSTALTNVQNQLSAPLTSAVGNVYQPVIVKRIKYTTPGGKTAYRLPENQSQFLYFDADYQLQNLVTTQNTRKANRI